jgi:dTDP-glucose 4,6-dehydratase
VHLIVTGAAGFIGSHFIDYVLENELINLSVSKVIGVDKLTYAGNIENLSEAFNDDRFQFIECDINDEELFKLLIEDETLIVNFAAESHVDNSINGSSIFYTTNVMGVNNLLEISRHRKNIRFIQISTDEVYGSIQNGSWNELSSIMPNSPYSASKAAADLMCLSYYKTYGMNIVITRSSNNYGPRQHSEKFLPTIINSLKYEQKIPVYGNGKNVRDWLYVKDNVKGIMSAIIHGEPGEIYNLGGGLEKTNLEMISLISKSFNLDYDPIEFVEDRKGHDFRYSIDFTKASKFLNYSPNTDLEYGIQRTIKSYLDR